jgi:cytochrome c-type biogenesis protein CcmF
MQRWTVLLAILTFGMSLVGTFLVRSGVLTSVHSFALSPARGVFILALIAAAVGGGLAVYAVRASRLAAGSGFAPVSREGALVLNNVLIAAGMATVFLGTFYPLFVEVWSGVKLSVGPPYFNETFVPIFGLVIAAMTVGPMLAWRRGDLGGALRRLAPAFAGALLVPAAVFVLDPGAPPAALAGLALALWAMLGVLADLGDRAGIARLPLRTCWRRLSHLPRSTWGHVLAHFGVGVLVAGITVSTAWRSTSITVMYPGSTVAIAGRTLRFVGVTGGTGPDYNYQRVEIRVEPASGAPFELYPERHYFPLAQTATAKTAIATTGFADLYLALGDPDGHGGWVVRAYYNPLVPWIWFGAIIAVFGGLVSLSDRLRWRRAAAGAAAAAIAASPKVR